MHYSLNKVKISYIIFRKDVLKNIGKINSITVSMQNLKYL